MKLVADEGVDRQIVERLRGDGHEVLYVAELEPGINDESVLRKANQEGALLVTADKDFGELIFRQQRTSGGVLLIRFAGAPPAEKATLISNALNRYGGEMLKAFTVLSPRNLRIRSRTIP